MPSSSFIPSIVDWLAVTDANNWPDRAGSGMTVSVDNSVQFQGHATLRIDIPAGSSGTYRVGTTGATVNLPASIDPYVCLTNHGVDNSGYNALGLSSYVDQVMTCADYLNSLGAPQGRLHHAYVQSQWDNSLSDALKTRGFLTARSGISTGTRNWQDRTPAWSGERRLMAYTSAEDLETGTTLANVQTQVLNAIAARQTCVIVGHRLEAAAGVDQWATADFTSLLSWLSGLKNSGLIDCVRVDDWYENQIGFVSPIA